MLIYFTIQRKNARNARTQETKGKVMINEIYVLSFLGGEQRDILEFLLIGQLAFRLMLDQTSTRFDCIEDM